MADPKKHQDEDKENKETKHEDRPVEKHVSDFASVIGAGVARVMRSRNAMVGFEAEFDTLVSHQCSNSLTETNAEVRDRLRKQLQDGRLVLESLESRLMHLITG